MEIAFLMDDLRQIDPEWDTTAQIMYECNQRGHEVFFWNPMIFMSVKMRWWRGCAIFPYPGISISKITGQT